MPGGPYTGAVVQASLDLPTSIFGLIDNIGPWEIMMVLVLLMVVVGPERLPEVARKIGRGIAQARAQMSSMSDEVRGVVDDPAMQPLREIGEFAMRPRQKLSEMVRLAEFDLTEEAAQIKALIKDEGTNGVSAAAAAAVTGPNSDDNPKAPRSIADLPEPGRPPGGGPHYPITMDDKLGGRRVPVDSEVAAQRRRDAGVPDHAAFRTRAGPLGSAGPDMAPEPVVEADGLPSPIATPVASTAFTARGAPLGERIAPAVHDEAPVETAAPDDPDGAAS